MATTERKLASELAIKEGGKSEALIADVRQVIKFLQEKIADELDDGSSETLALMLKKRKRNKKTAVAVIIEPVD